MANILFFFYLFWDNSLVTHPLSSLAFFSSSELTKPRCLQSWLVYFLTFSQVFLLVDTFWFLNFTNYILASTNLCMTSRAFQLSTFHVHMCNWPTIFSFASSVFGSLDPPNFFFFLFLTLSTTSILF